MSLTLSLALTLSVSLALGFPVFLCDLLFRSLSSCSGSLALTCWTVAWAQLENKKEFALKLVKFENVVYTDEEGYLQESEAKEKGLDAKKLSGTEFRRLMRAGEPVPEWFAFKCVIDVLQGKNA